MLLPRSCLSLSSLLPAAAMLSLAALASRVPAQEVAAPEAAPPASTFRPAPPQTFATLFEPYRTDVATLSPDGRYLAYSVRTGTSLEVFVLEVDRPGQLTARVAVGTDETSTAMLAQTKERTPAAIRWMRWATPTRLVIATNRVTPISPASPDGDWSSVRGAVLAVNADGSDARTLVTPHDVAEMRLPGAADFNVARNEGFVDPNRLRLHERIGTEFGLTPPLDQRSQDEMLFGDPTSAGFTQDAREPQVVDLAPGTAGDVIIRAGASPRFQLYTLHTTSGKLTPGAPESVPEGHISLGDRLGRPRVTLPVASSFDFPLRYRFNTGAALFSWKPLDDLTRLAPEGRTAFALTRDAWFDERAVPLGFGDDFNQFYYASNVGRDTFGLYSFDLKTGQRTGLAVEHPRFDLVDPAAGGFPDPRTLVFDRHTRALAGIRLLAGTVTTQWLEPELREMQRTLEAKFPGENVELLEWDAARQRFLVLVHGPANPGAFHLLDTSGPRLTEFVQRAPRPADTPRRSALHFTFPSPSGIRLSGTITFPASRHGRAVPLLFYCAAEPWQRVPVGYQGEIQALAEMGFAVVQLNARGAWGFGLTHRRALLTGGYEAAQAEDILHALAYLEKTFHVNPQRVGLIGQLRGGFLALRALQLHPTRFRCAIAINPTIDLGQWLDETVWQRRELLPTLAAPYYGDQARLAAAPLRKEPELIKTPVLVLSYPGPEGAPRQPAYNLARNFTAAVRRAGTTADFEDLSQDYAAGLPAARGHTYDRIQEFLYAHIFDYVVNVGETRVLKDGPPPATPAPKP